MFCAKLDFVVDQCLSRDTLIVLGKFNATTDIVRISYVLCLNLMFLVPKMQTVNFFDLRKAQRVESCWFAISKTRALPLERLGLWQRRSITFSLILVLRFFRALGFTGLQIFLRPITDSNK